MRRTFWRILSLLMALTMILGALSSGMIAYAGSKYVTDTIVGLDGSGKPVRWNYGRYTGYVNDANLPDGQGTLIYANNVENYISYFVYPNGEVSLFKSYTGGFKDGYRYGSGKLTFADDSYKYGTFYGSLADALKTSSKLTWEGTFYDTSGYTVTGYSIAVDSTHEQNIWNEYIIEYDANGGSGAPSYQRKPYTVSINLSTQTPTRDGYDFLGWSTSKTGSVNYYPGSTYSTDAGMILYAVWKLKEYTISYNANYGTGAPSSQKKTHGTNINLSSTVPSRTGYDFLGWSKSNTATTASYAPGAVFSENANTDLYAVWKLKEYKVDYHANGGTGAPASQTKYYGTALALSTTKPSRQFKIIFDPNNGSCPETTRTLNCTFNNWNTVQGGTGKTYSPGDTYSANSAVTLYAQYTNPVYGTLPEATRKGYRFEGWYTAKTGGTRVFASTVSDSSRTLYARWSQEYMIDYDGQGGTNVPTRQTKIEDLSLTLSEIIPVKTGYTFDNWNTMADGKGVSYSPSSVYTDNSSATLFAQYTKNKYTATFFINDVPYDTKTITFEDKIVVPEDPKMDGYIFVGWSPEVPETMPAKDLEFHAIWKKACAHNNTKIVKETPTCVEDGSQYTVCLDCGEIVKELEIIPATGHSPELSWLIVCHATCTTDGCIAGHCKYCGILIDSKIIESKGHGELNWVITKEATCSSAGQETGYCKICSKMIETKEISKLSHVEGEWVTIHKATCTSDGEKACLCSICGTIFKTETINMLSHTEGAWVTTTPATCTTDGEKVCYCSTCGELIKTETISANGHDNGVWKVDYEANDSHDGSMTKYCTKCGEALETKSFSKHTHTFGYESVLRESTCTSDGLKGKFCSICNACYETETIKASKHGNIVYVISTPATCKTDGEKTGYCSDCGKIVATEVISKTGHELSDWSTNNNGTHSRTCLNCGCAEKQNCEYETKVVKATLTEYGYTVHTCKVCGHSFKDNFMNILTHTWTEWQDNGDGTHSRYCHNEDCLAEETAEHSFGEWEFNHDSTFCENGTKTRVCEFCAAQETETAEHTSFFWGSLYRFGLIILNIINKVFYSVSLQWLFPWVNLKPQM